MCPRSSAPFFYLVTYYIYLGKIKQNSLIFSGGLTNNILAPEYLTKHHATEVMITILTRDEDPDLVGSVDFGPPDPVLFSTDPDQDPTCNNGFIKLFLS